MTIRFSPIVGMAVLGAALNASAGGVGTYSVPVPSELKSVATFPIQNLAFSKEGDGNVTLQYDLPDELVGAKPVTVVLKGSGLAQSPMVLSGPLGDASCEGEDSALKCQVVYSGHLQDRLSSDDVRTLLESRYLDQPELLGIKEAVSRLFSNDPVGELEFEWTEPRPLEEQKSE